MNSVDDVAVEGILAAIDAMSTLSAEWQYPSAELLHLPRRLEGARRSDGTEISFVEATEHLLRGLGKRGRYVSRYGAAGERPDSSEWVAWFGTLSKVVRLKMGRPQDSAFRRWLEYLVELDRMPHPSEISREAHMAGPRGFLRWLQTKHAADRRSYAKVLQYLGQLFDVLCEEGEMMANPIRSSDLPASKPPNNKTTKADLPPQVMGVVQEILSELCQHAFDQFDALSRQVWKPAGLERGADWVRGKPSGLLPTVIQKPECFERLAVTLRGEDGAIERVLSPVLPIMTLWKCKIPNRGIEPRLADSGEADEWLPSLWVEQLEGAGQRVRAEMIRNPGPLAIRGRRQGAIRIIVDGEREIVGLYISTNKSQKGGHTDGADRGREIPWDDTQLLMGLYRLRLWQASCNPVDHLLSRDQLSTSELRPSDGLVGVMPQYAFLHRHLQDGDLARRLEPPTAPQAHKFFMDVLDEAEARIAARRSANCRSGTPIIPRIVLNRVKGLATRCAYSGHSLRSNGLTRLDEAGLPFWMLSEVIAGHQNWNMTWYYVQRTAGQVIDSLALARERMVQGLLQDSADDASTSDAESLRARFASDHPTAVGLGGQIAGFWLPMHDGMCPNGATLCHKGGPQVEGTSHHGPVEGGARNCALCRFFFTGPRFIPGQVALINASLYAARKRARGLQELWVERRAEGSGTRRAQYDDRIKRVEAELALVSVPDQLESIESVVIRWRRADSQEPGHVDDREPHKIRPQQAALSQRSDRRRVGVDQAADSAGQARRQQAYCE